MQLLKTLFVLLILGTYAVYSASAEQPEVRNVYFFGQTEHRAYDLDYLYFHLDTPLTEYKILHSWQMSERSLSPDEIDVVVLLSHGLPEGENIKVNADLFEKVGPLTGHEIYGVTDIEAGLSRAMWSDKPTISRTIAYTTEPEVRQLATTIKSIPVMRLAMDKWNEDKWTYELKATVWLECGACNSDARIEKVIQLTPKD